MRIEVRDGVLHTDGTPGLLATADYPYYRDSPDVWRDRLRSLRDSTGIRTVTSYLPWRHHQPDADTPPDFTGATRSDRDVVGFLRICAELGLDVIAKPGPFIHAETNYGGLPDWICPLADDRVEAALDADGHPVCWSGSDRGPDGKVRDWPLPAPLGTYFTAQVTEWLRSVGKDVLQDATTPAGPVVLVQIANEGLFTDGARPLRAYDYSRSGLDFHRQGLRERYGDLAAYNAVHATGYTAWEQIPPPRERRAAADVREQIAYADWGRHHSDLLTEAYHAWTAALGPAVPVVVNLNPPAGDHHSLDDWLARVRPERWNAIAYGFTNWMGVVSTDPGAHARYVVAAKRAPGPNLEENWGFSELYDRAYASGTTSFHQTLLALAAGATGFNVYTGVATSDWGDDLDILHGPPYPDCPPVDAAGTATAKAGTVRMLADFFAVHGAEFLAARPATGPTWALYAPYAAVAAWNPEGHRGGPECGRPLREFHDRVRAAGQDYRIVDLESATAERLADHPRLTLHGGEFMDARVQGLLADHVRAGRGLELLGPVPRLDERLQPCTLLADALADAPGDRGADRHATGPVPGSGPVRVRSGSADAYWRATADGRTGYLTVLVQSDNEGPVTVTLELPEGTRTAEVHAARGGAALLRISAGALDDFLVTGVNTFLDSAVTPVVTVDGRGHRGTAPADLARIGGRISAG